MDKLFFVCFIHQERILKCTRGKDGLGNTYEKDSIWADGAMVIGTCGVKLGMERLLRT